MSTTDETQSVLAELLRKLAVAEEQIAAGQVVDAKRFFKAESEILIRLTF